MAKRVAIPKLGLTMAEATIVEWKVAEGATVQAGQPIVEIEMDKAAYELEALDAGVVHIVAQKGQVVPVGGLIAALAQSPEEYQELLRAPVEASPGPRPSAAAPVLAGSETPQAPAVARPPTALPQTGAGRASPLARRLAEAHGIDLSQLQGTGPGGAIRQEDVQHAVDAKGAPAPAPATVAQPRDPRRVRARLPLAGLRRAVAHNLLRSLQGTAQMTQLGDIDMAALTQFRQGYNARAANQEERVTYTDLLIKAAALTLKKHPGVNATIEGEEVVIWDSINVGVAVPVKENEYFGGLVVPVIHDADKKPLGQIHVELTTLAARAQARRLGASELAGATFVLTNMGAAGVGGIYGTPIAPVSVSAILQVSGIAQRPAVWEGQLAARPLMGYSLTIDHRLIDGLNAGLFMEDLKALLQSPGALS